MLCKDKHYCRIEHTGFSWIIRSGAGAGDADGDDDGGGGGGGGGGISCSLVNHSLYNREK